MTLAQYNLFAPAEAVEPKPQRTPHTFHRDADFTIEQSIDRCPDCQAILTIRERINDMQWQTIYSLTRQEHNVECVARDKTKRDRERQAA